MKAKDRRKLEREAQRIRAEMGLPQVDLKRLMAVDNFKSEILRAAAQANRKPKDGDGSLRT